LADEVERGLGGALSGLRNSAIKAVGAMIEGQTPNTAEMVNLLALGTERQDNVDTYAPCNVTPANEKALRFLVRA
jgi:hypothetical protein